MELKEAISTLRRGIDTILNCDVPSEQMYAALKIVEEKSAPTEERNDSEGLATALKNIKQILGYGMFGSPTDGKYHKTSYQQAYEIATAALIKVNSLPSGETNNQTEPYKSELCKENELLAEMTIQGDNSPTEERTDSKLSGESNNESSAIALLKEIYYKTDCVNADACKYQSTFYMTTYDWLEKIVQQENK